MVNAAMTESCPFSTQGGAQESLQLILVTSEADPKNRGALREKTGNQAMFNFGAQSANNNVIGMHADMMLTATNNGLVAGTKVATQMGWRPVEAVTAGDQVLTFDGGLQDVVSVRRDVVWTGGSRGDMDAWPLHVPAGALGNTEDMLLMPGQAILVESDTAEQVLGDPFALIPAASLDGFRGIQRIAPQDRVEVVSIVFAQDEIVFANSGALFLCAASNDMFDAGTSEYQMLSLAQADILVGCLEAKDTGQMPASNVVTAFRFAA